MLNRIFKQKLFRILTLLLLVTIIACEKEQDTIAVIIVKDTNNNTIHKADVTLSQDSSLVQINGEYMNLDSRTEPTDVNGRVEFIYPLEAVLNIDVFYTQGNDTLRGQNVIVLQRGKQVTKVVNITSVN